MDTPPDPTRVRAALGRFRPQSSFRRRLLAPVAVSFSKLLLQGLNTLETHNLRAFTEARDQDRALITFSNHVSLFDDPWLVGTFSGWRWDGIRWCATDAINFFDHPLSARFFSAGKGVPIVRGAGLDQLGMHFLEDRLNDGDWVHIFPEGGRSREPRQLRPLKSGLGHLVERTKPLLLPFHHRGMENVLPIGAKWPRTGNLVQLRFGEVTDSAAGLAEQGPDAVTAWAQAQLLELQDLWDR